MPQESGHVNNNREAILAIRFVDGAIFDCVIDTGFDGALLLPKSAVAQLEIPIIARLAFELVGGERMVADVALAEINWLGQQRTVELIMSEGDDALIGTEMFEGSKLVIDYSSQEVIITS
jgi:clan AA aspartic protease